MTTRSDNLPSWTAALRPAARRAVFVAAGVLAACGQITVVPLEDAAQDVASDAVDLALSVTVESPANGAVVHVGESVHFAARATGGPIPLDQLTATWTAAGDKVLASGPLTADGVSQFDKADLPPGPQAIHLEVSDGNGIRAGRDLGILVNTPPNAPGVSISPAQPTTRDDLVPHLTQAPSDVDRAADKLQVRFSWHKLGGDVVYPGGSQGELAAGTHRRGETWVVTAIASDGNADSAAATAQVVIVNAPPTAPAPAVMPPDAHLLSDLACVLAQPATDADGDAVTVSYSWRVGDYVNPGATVATLNADKLAVDAKGSSLVAGDSVRCGVALSDGSTVTAELLSPPVSVGPEDICGSPLNPCDANAACANTNTLEVICSCKADFVGDGKTCVDIDECAAGYCSPNAQCTNTIGGHQCPCKAGYEGAGDQDCSDVNECAVKPGPCGANADCVNTDGSFQCACSPGYTGDGQVCKDKDECAGAVSPCPSGLACKNTVGSYLCIDLCATATCSVDATCKNTFSGFACTCKPGYKGDGKICVQQNECDNGDAVCAPDATCTDTPGSYQCACKPGYAGDGTTCNDVDECATGQAMCGANAKCANSPGGFACSCKDGFDMTAAGCVDINECAALPGPCAEHADCVNSEGGFTCNCQPGYFGDGAQFCSTQDLCALGSCSDHATCATAPVQAGSCSAVAGTMIGDLEARCTCEPGWVGCGTADNVCIDINECATLDPCDAHASCDNTPGGYTCTCKAGFVGDGSVCLDVNECAATMSPCAQDALCSNTVGAFACACPSGFAGDAADPGASCLDINECQDGSAGCGVHATCDNTPGGFSCTCNSGYSGDGKACVDVDECASGTACSAHATCTNSDGGFSCTCKPGFSGDGQTCTDVDECANGTAGCAATATCLNTPGSFSCTCKPGYSGDGSSCVDVNECPTAEWTWDFATLAGWQVDPAYTYNASNPQTSAIAPDVRWQLLNGTLYYGNPQAGNYATAVGADTWANRGTATGPAITLSSHPWHQLGFDARIDTDVGTYFDKLQVQLVIEGSTPAQVITVWDKAQQTAAMGEWKHYTVYLNGYGGKTVRVRLAFDTVDAVNNATSGVQIDGLAFTPAGTPCHPYASCTNTQGSFACACQAPYAGDGVQACNVLGSQSQPAASCKAILDLDGTLSDGLYWLQWGSAPAAQLWCDGNGWTRMVQNDFNGSAGTWSPKTLTTCGGSGLLGGVGVGGAGYAATCALGNLPPHSQLRVQASVQTIDQWNGAAVQVVVDGASAWSESATNPPASAQQPDSCGSKSWADLKHYPKATVAHSAPSATVGFTSNLSVDSGTASLGIDDVNIWVK